MNLKNERMTINPTTFRSGRSRVSVEKDVPLKSLVDIQLDIGDSFKDDVLDDVLQMISKVLKARKLLEIPEILDEVNAKPELLRSCY